MSLRYLSAARILELDVLNEGCEPTSRLIPGDPNFDYPEWRQKIRIAGVTYYAYYRTTPEDAALVESVGGDWGEVDWPERLDHVEDVDGVWVW